MTIDEVIEFLKSERPFDPEVIRAAAEAIGALEDPQDALVRLADAARGTLRMARFNADLTRQPAFLAAMQRRYEKHPYFTKPPDPEAERLSMILRDRGNPLMLFDVAVEAQIRCGELRGALSWLLEPADVPRAVAYLREALARAEANSDAIAAYADAVAAAVNRGSIGTPRARSK